MKSVGDDNKLKNTQCQSDSVSKGISKEDETLLAHSSQEEHKEKLSTNRTVSPFQNQVSLTFSIFSNNQQSPQQDEEEKLTHSGQNEPPQQQPSSNIQPSPQQMKENQEGKQAQQQQQQDQPQQQQQQLQQKMTKSPYFIQSKFIASKYSAFKEIKIIVPQSNLQTISKTQKIQESLMRLQLDSQMLSQKNLKKNQFLRKDQNHLKRFTSLIIETFQCCKQDFNYQPSQMNPKRDLTHPSEPMNNNGYDNVDFDYILRVSDSIITPEGKDYEILELLGKGTFGQVVKCQCQQREFVAIKVIKNKKAFKNQGVIEIKILDLLNRIYDPSGESPIVRMLDFFVFREHLCIVFDLLSASIFDLLRENNYRGLSLNINRIILQQILDAMKIVKDAKLIHCDLKPENILFKSKETMTLKVIDFGSACFEGYAVFQYIQSRYYRSPEVIMGLPYDSSIDMWSLGCIAAELFLGIPIFPGNSEYDQLAKIIEVLGQPPQQLIQKCLKRDHFFLYIPDEGRYRLKTLEEFQFSTGKIIEPPIDYHHLQSLDQLKEKLMEKKRIQLAEREGKDKNSIINPNILESEMNAMDAFIDFLKGLLRIDKDQRWTPSMAKEHPFITREQYTGPFEPQREPERVSTNETENDTMSEKSTSSKDSEKYKVGSCPSKLMYPASVSNQPQYLTQQQFSHSEQSVFHGQNPMIQSHRPPILNIPDEYFKGFMFGRLDQILSMTREQLIQFIYEQNEIKYKEEMQRNAMRMQQQQRLFNQLYQQQQQIQQIQSLQQQLQQQPQNLQLQQQFQLLLMQQQQQEQQLQLSTQQIQQKIMNMNQSQNFQNPSFGQFPPQQFNLYQQQQMPPTGFQHQYPQMMVMQQPPLSQQQQQYYQHFGQNTFAQQNFHQNNQEQPSNPLFQPQMTMGQQELQNFDLAYSQQQNLYSKGSMIQNFPNKEMIFFPPPYTQKQQFSNNPFDQQIFQGINQQYMNQQQQQQQQIRKNQQRMEGGGGQGGQNKGKAGSWHPPPGLQPHKYNQYYNQINNPGQLIGRQIQDYNQQQQQQFIHQNFQTKQHHQKQQMKEQVFAQQHQKLQQQQQQQSQKGASLGLFSNQDFKKGPKKQVSKEDPPYPPSQIMFTSGNFNPQYKTGVNNGLGNPNMQGSSFNLDQPHYILQNPQQPLQTRDNSSSSGSSLFYNDPQTQPNHTPSLHNPPNIQQKGQKNQQVASNASFAKKSSKTQIFSQPSNNQQQQQQQSSTQNLQNQLSLQQQKESYIERVGLQNTNNQDKLFNQSHYIQYQKQLLMPPTSGSNIYSRNRSNSDNFNSNEESKNESSSDPHNQSNQSIETGSDYIKQNSSSSNLPQTINISNKTLTNNEENSQTQLIKGKSGFEGLKAQIQKQGLNSSPSQHPNSAKGYTSFKFDEEEKRSQGGGGGSKNIIQIQNKGSTATNYGVSNIQNMKSASSGGGSGFVANPILKISKHKIDTNCSLNPTNQPNYNVATTSATTILSSQTSNNKKNEMGLMYQGSKGNKKMEEGSPTYSSPRQQQYVHIIQQQAKLPHKQTSLLSQSSGHNLTPIAEQALQGAYHRDSSESSNENQYRERRDSSSQEDDRF